MMTILAGGTSQSSTVPIFLFLYTTSTSLQVGNYGNGNGNGNDDRNYHGSGNGNHFTPPLPGCRFAMEITMVIGNGNNRDIDIGNRNIIPSLFTTSAWLQVHNGNNIDTGNSNGKRLQYLWKWQWQGQ